MTDNVPLITLFGVAGPVNSTVFLGVLRGAHVHPGQLVVELVSEPVQDLEGGSARVARID